MNSVEAAAGHPVAGDEAKVVGPHALKHSLVGLVGASIEWYDFLLYGTAAAVVFPTLFFSTGLSPFAALIASFSTFAVGFVARPIGAILFGQLGDKVGRKLIFCSCLIVMGLATGAIGLLPTYRTVGSLAPIALVLLRLTQGLAVGGQWGGATLLATEGAPQSKRGFYGSIAQLGFPLGMVLANLALLITTNATSPEAFMAYGWRIPFLLSGVLVIVALYIHFRVEDTAADKTLRQSSQVAPVPESVSGAPAGVRSPAGQVKAPLLQALRLYPRLILLAAGANIGAALATYIMTTYVAAYATSAGGLHMTRGTLLSASLIAQVVSMPLIIVAGRLSDRFGRWRIYMLGTVLTGAWVFAFFPMIETRSFPLITLAMCIGLACWSLTYGPIGAMYAELFRFRMRYSAVSMTYQLSGIIGGGLGPIAAASIYAHFHSNLWVSGLIGVGSLLSLLCAAQLANRPAESMVE